MVKLENSFNISTKSLAIILTMKKVKEIILRERFKIVEKEYLELYQALRIIEINREQNKKKTINRFNDK